MFLTLVCQRPKGPSIDASVRTSSTEDGDQSDELSISNASDMETKWIEQDEPGVYITIRALQVELENSGVSASAERSLEKCMQDYGGKRTMEGYKSNNWPLHRLADVKALQ